jgi:glucose/arabinose dehydrogenase
MSGRGMTRRSRTEVLAVLCGTALLAVLLPTAAQEPAEPLVFDAYVPDPCSPNGQSQGQCPPGNLLRVRLAPVAEGLTNPRHLAFLPDGGLLVAELPGHVRVVRDGEVTAAALGGWPADGLEAVSLHSVLVHPEFARNRFVYLYYVKTGADGMTTMGLARGRLQGEALREIEAGAGASVSVTR